LAGPVTGFDVLACHQCQQRHRIGLLLGENEPVFDEVLSGPYEFVGVVDEFRYQPVPVGGVFPVTRRPPPLEVVLADPHRGEFGDQLADPADLGGDHRDRVLAGDRVIEDRGVQRPAGLAREHLRLGYQRGSTRLGGEVGGFGCVVVVVGRAS